MGEVFITRKGGGGKAAAPTIAVTDVGGSWAEVSITNNDAAPSGATLFVLANYDPNSATDFDLQASQNGYVFTVAEGATVTQLVTGLDPDTSHTVSASAAVIKKLPSSVVTTDTISLNGVGAQPAPSLGSIVSNSTNVSNQNTTVISVTNNDTRIPLVIKANFTTNTTAPTTYPFETASVGVGATTNLTLTGLTGTTTYYIHARAFDGTFSSSNVVFGPYTTDTSPLYAFTTWTFTNAGVTGRTGPNISQVRSAYSSQSWAQNNAYLAMTTNGIQNWTVPATGSYQIEAFGAQGSTATSSTGGLGARMRGDVTLTKGEVIRILVGQNAPNTFGRANLSSSGGGGSFVVRAPHNTNQSILVIAGGGGGTGNQRPETSNATTATTGQTGSHGSGGVNGNGGTTPDDSASAGAGFFTNGGGNGGGLAFVSGGEGGIINGTYSNQGGGFGGGGSVVSGGNSRYSGGGGYSGGSGSSNAGGATTGLWGGGGGSFNSGTNQSNSAGARSGHGQVIITKL